MALTHIFACVLLIVMASLRVRSWRRWEEGADSGGGGATPAAAASASAPPSPAASLWHQVAITKVPPGFSARLICSTYLLLSTMCSPDSQAQTRSNDPGSNSSARASMTRKVTFSRPWAWASCVARVT